MSVRYALAALLLFLCAGRIAGAQASPEVTFRFENPKLQPASYVLQFRPDGSGHFHAEAGPSPPDDIAALPAEGQDRDIHISQSVADRIFSIAKQKKFFAFPCDSGSDSVAFQGKKTLSYQGPAGQGSCTYNYSKDQQIQWITAECQGIAITLEEGRRLQLRYEHGRLSLDAELETIEELARDGQATELGNIAPILTTIASDDRVMERAQRRARKLLALSQNAQSSK